MYFFELLIPRREHTLFLKIQTHSYLCFPSQDTFFFFFLMLLYFFLFDLRVKKIALLRVKSSK